MTYVFFRRCFQSDAIVQHAQMEAPAGTTHISQLNDACLRKVFEHLNVHDLSAIADVSQRFRNTARAQSSRFKKLRLIHNFFDCDEVLFSRTLRHFGPTIDSIEISGRFLRPKEEYRLVELLSRHCKTTLVDLTVCRLKTIASSELLGEILTTSSPPLFSRLKTLSIGYCGLNQMFLAMLLKWIPSLRELVLDHTSNADARFVGLHRNFPALESISLFQVSDVSVAEIQLTTHYKHEAKHLS